MCTITNKLRIIVAISAVCAALASSSVASAAFAVRAPGSGTPVLAGQTTVVAQYIDPNKVGSAGIPGYDDAKCEGLAGAHNADENDAVQAAKNGDALAAQGYAELAGDLQNELENNCFVID